MASAGIGTISLILLTVLGLLVLMLIIRKPAAGLAVLLLMTVAGGILMSMMARSQRRAAAEAFLQTRLEEQSLLERRALTKLAPPSAQGRTTVDGGIYVGPEGVRVSLPGVSISTISAEEPPEIEARELIMDDEPGFRVAQVFPSEWDHSEVRLPFLLEDIGDHARTTSQATNLVEFAAREYGSELLERHLLELTRGPRVEALADVQAYLRDASAEAVCEAARSLVTQTQQAGGVEIGALPPEIEGGARRRQVVLHIPRKTVSRVLWEAGEPVRESAQYSGLRVPTFPVAIAIVLVAYLVLKSSTRRSRTLKL